MKYVSRAIQKNIEKRIGENKVLLIFGTRRTGKTKMIESIKKNLKQQNLFLNGEDLDTQAILAKRTAANYKLLIGKNKVLFIDEAQVIPDIGKHLKFMIDSFPKLTIVATGSSSFDLMNKSGEPLTGRAYQYYLYPFSVNELMNNEGYLSSHQQLEERLIFGSYPEVLQLTTADEKQEYLKTLVQQYLLKDIFMYETVKNASKVYDLLKLLAYQTGSEVSYDELSKSLSVSKNTVERYMDLLAKVFVIFKVGGYSGNLRKEVVKSSKWYFFDNGIRNAIISDFRNISLRNDTGQLWENFCFYERIKKQHYNLKTPDYFFWRTYDGQEIDMIEKAGSKLSAFEFKWKNTGKTKPPKAFAVNYPKAGFEIIHAENYLEFVR